MFQACLSEIAVQTDATFLGKLFELRPDFIRTSESMYSGRFLFDYLFFFLVNEFLLKGNQYTTVLKKDTFFEPATSPTMF